MTPQELSDAKTRCAELKTEMDDLRTKIQSNTALARAANAVNVELMSSLKTSRTEHEELGGQIREAEDAIRKVQVEKAAKDQQAIADENAKRAAETPPQPTTAELMEEIRKLKEVISSKD